MDAIQFVPLNSVREEEIIALMNEERVGRLLPLLVGEFTAEDCRAFIAAKQALWDTHGYGPWAFVINGKFAGWGGLQAEAGDADFALILHPQFWGWGRKIYQRIVADAFERMQLDSITILFPPTRTNARAIERLGFVADGEVIVDDETFHRYRLHQSRAH